MYPDYGNSIGLEQYLNSFDDRIAFLFRLYPEVIILLFILCLCVFILFVKISVINDEIKKLKKVDNINKAKEPQDKIICPKCGKENNKINSFCTNCHYTFDKSSPSNNDCLPKFEKLDNSKIRCPDCNAINNKTDTFCIKCFYKFTEKDKN